jgi:hypothetical protein
MEYASYHQDVWRFWWLVSSCANSDDHIVLVFFLEGATSGKFNG